MKLQEIVNTSERDTPVVAGVLIGALLFLIAIGVGIWALLSDF